MKKKNPKLIKQVANICGLEGTDWHSKQTENTIQKQVQSLHTIGFPWVSVQADMGPYIVKKVQMQLGPIVGLPCSHMACRAQQRNWQSTETCMEWSAWELDGNPNPGAAQTWA